MASVVIDDRDKDAFVNCGLCLRCGQPADVMKRKSFTWQPVWVSLSAVLGLLICLPVAVLVVLTGTWRKAIQVPLCMEHKNHWLWRQFLVPLISLLALVASYGAVAAVIIAASDAPGRQAQNNDIKGLVCVGWLFLGLAWLIAMSIFQSGAIRATNITDDSITLCNVSDVFVQGYQESLRYPDAVADEYVREHWEGGKAPQQRSEGDSRFRPPVDRPGKQPPDAIQEGL